MWRVRAACRRRDLNRLDCHSHRTDLESIERCLMQIAMQRGEGNLSQAARLLSITRPQLAYRLKKEGLPAA